MSTEKIIESALSRNPVDLRDALAEEMKKRLRVALTELKAETMKSYINKRSNQAYDAAYDALDKGDKKSKDKSDKIWDKYKKGSKQAQKKLGPDTD